MSNIFNQRNYRMRSNTITQNIESDINWKIINEITNGKLDELKILINSENVNKIINKNNNCTVLHYAISSPSPSDDIIKYLLDCGADPKIKQNKGKDCYELASNQYLKFLLDHTIANKDNQITSLYIKIDDLKYDIKKLESVNNNLKETIDYLNKSTDEYIKSNDNITKELNEQKVLNTKLKRKAVDMETAFKNVLETTKKDKKDNK